MTRNGSPPPRWPDLPREGVDLPPLSSDPTERELARHYATVAAAYHEFLPKIVDALEWLKAHVIVRVSLPPTPEETPAMRARMKSVQELEDAAEAATEAVEEAAERLGELAEDLEEAVTGTKLQTVPFNSERVRAITREELDRAEAARRAAEQAKANAEAELARHQANAVALALVERRTKILLAVIAGVFALLSAIVALVKR